MNDQIPNMDYDADEVIENFKAKFKWPSKDEVDVVVKPPKFELKVFISIIITAILGFGIYYMMIPAANFKTTESYVFVIALIAICIAVLAILIGANKKIERKEYIKKKSVVPVIIVAVIVVAMIIGYLCGCTLFRAKTYSHLMPVSESSFAEDFEGVDYSEVPRLDAITAKVLADQKLGSLSEYKSQYIVSQTSTQINYKGRPVRVAYLEYGDVFKWFNNTKKGLPAYMLIDVVTQEVTVVNCINEFGEGIKYSPTELFNEKLVRHLRFQYPTAIMDTPNFEIDDNGHPFWITPVFDRTIGLFGGTDVKGVIITDALNGESDYYTIQTVKEDQSLNWIDVVYSETLLVEQYNYYGKFSHGFWNSLFFQNDVNVTSSGNGFIAMNDDVWVYTGVTSSESDNSNFGFILCNQRTKETRYYANGGAMETSAKESAEGSVQNYGYRAIFPILLDIENQPTYFMSLYDANYIVKGYALVNLDDKTLVGTGLTDTSKSDGAALNAAVENYINALKDKGKISANANADDYFVNEDDIQQPEEEKPENTETATSVTGQITDIKTSVNNGNTVYYLQVNGKYYYIAVSDCMDVLLMQKGDSVTITFDDNSSKFVKANSVK